MNLQPMLNSNSQRMKSPNYYARTETNQRENNEDCYNGFLIEDQGGKVPVFVVADGMGGHEHGEDVSRQAVLKVEDFLKKTIEQISLQSDPIKYLKQCLLDAIESANELVQRMVSVNGWDRAGSTIVIALVWQNKVIAANLGDSPLFHWSQNTGNLDRVTQDHSVPGILAQAKLITEEMVRYHERRGQLEFFLGSKNLPKPDPIYERSLEPGDLLLLCSDGISGALSREQIRAVLADSAIDLPDKANQLIEAARDEGETDNQTVILWRYKLPSQTTSTRNIAAPTAIQPKSQPTLIQSSIAVHPQTQTPSRTRRKRSLSRKKLLLLFVVCIGAIAAATLIFFQLRSILQARTPANPQPTSNPPLQQPPPAGIATPSPTTPPGLQSPSIEFHQIVNVSPNGLILTTRDPRTQEPSQWEAVKLKSGGRECRIRLIDPVEQQDINIIDQTRDFVETESKKLGCIRVWKLKPAIGNPSRLPNKSADVPIVSIQGEHA
ncbi:protein phosphatase 2C domain-containing protein [Pseudanabaenaceae cyanobacterium LEGE 13415]|nr:protein phosphatase 2C domain-containing protein [Pseudanabaenaceae cyanobacterium LEGE 13415]